MKNKRLSLVLCMASILLLGANAGFAGEVNGKGDWIPGGEKGRSECSYSGQQDNAAQDEGVFKGDRVQNWGQLTELGRFIFATFFGITRADEGCNPNKAGGS